jgi:hypothetical protein
VTYTHKHLVVRLNGHFGANNVTRTERWSSGVRVAIPTGDIQMSTPALQTFANSVHAAAATMMAATGMGIGSNTFMDFVTAARVGTDGKYDPPTQVTIVSTGAVAAGTGVPIFPWTTAHALSLRTGAPRGYASNGRFYLPYISGAIAAATGRLVGSEVTSRLTGFRTFLQAVNTAAGVYDVGATVCVMSQVGAGKTMAVTSVRADDRADSIERRENDQVPAYTTLNL